MPALQITLLGGFAATLDDQSLTSFRSAKSRALLAYLAAQPEQEHLRAHLATLLWGDLPESAARTNLRIELSGLKKLLGNHPALEISRHTVRMRRQGVTVDLIEFNTAVVEFMQRPVESQGSNIEQLDAAIARYRGEFLAGFQINDAAAFDDWRLLLQEHLHQQLMLALKTLQQHYAEQGRWPELAAAARRQLAIIPWLESAQRYLIQALAAQGQRQAALAQYRECCRILQDELGADPEPATRELADRLSKPCPVLAPSRHNLVQQLTSFIGREAEITQLHALIQRERLVTLFGLGGVGKSRLAHAVARTALNDFADGVWFVALANIEPGAAGPDQIALAIAGAIGFQITNVATPGIELAAYLADKHLLLVLDNWEHLIASAEASLYPLLQTRAVHILATSRLRLAIAGEWPVQLTGLPQEQAVTLFVDRARRIVPTFAVDDNTPCSAQDIAAICAQVDGLPLGIELAASWVEHFPVAEIGAALAQIDVEPTQADGLISRHHSLNSVLEYSWRLLSPALQQILARCTVFRGGFDRAAATAVVDSGLDALSALLAHSLLQGVAAGRYDLHPLVQEFAARKLRPEQLRALQHQHSDYYLAALVATPASQRADRLLLDFENIRSAWQQVARAGEVRLIRQSAVPFGEFIAQFGLMRDGHQLFADAVERMAEQIGEQEMLAQLLDQQWVFARTIHGLSAASPLQHRLLGLTRDSKLQVKTHIELANCYAEEGNWTQADTHFEQAETLTRNCSDLYLTIHAAKRRIHVNALHFRGDYGAGIQRLNELLALLDSEHDYSDPMRQEADNLRLSLRMSLALVATRYGDYALSIRCGRQNLAWVDGLGHQQQKIWILLDLALSEQFAGLYPQAIAHNQEGLALAEAIGAADDIGLLQANLCLTLRQSGELEQGLSYGLKAVDILRTRGYSRMEGQARNRVGHTLAALGRWAEAYAAYTDALQVWAPQRHSNRYEALAGHALAAYRLGKTDDALAALAEVLDFLESQGLSGLSEPVLLLLNCATVLQDTGRSEPARQILQQAADWVQTIAGR
ncbi:MAG: hypothetical protein KDK04_09285, partial [Candidatus Competibacteraceae bacterium]|nr:hypothetical protein [Candidatus Competibacteraceae bacterium]